MLKGKTAVITGASRGIGKGIVELFAKNNANIVLVAGNEKLLSGLTDEINNNGGNAIYSVCDVSIFESAQDVINKAVEKFGRVDVLVNNAGIAKDNLILRMKENEWDDVIQVNLKGNYNFIKACSRVMMKQRQGSIINVSSIIGIIGNAGQANYAASKGGVIALTKSVAKEFASRNIRANVIAPGFITTDMTDNLGEEAKEQAVKAIPLGRLGKPCDIAKTALFLASDLSSYITGQILVVDGGMTL